MRPEGRLLEERKLQDGLTVYFYDQSRPIVGDRCQVQLLVHVPLEIKQVYFENHINPEAFENCVAAFGKEMPFQQKKTRNFISNDKAEALLQQMKKEFLESGPAYLSKPNFAQRYIVQRFDEWKQEEGYRAAHCKVIGEQTKED